MSKHEDSLNEILPQLLIIVRRLSAMNHGVEPKGDAAIAQNILFVFLNFKYDTNPIITPKEKYKDIGDSILSNQYSNDYEPITNQLAQITPVYYSFAELRRRLYEFKNEAVSVSSTRHREHKLQMLQQSEKREVWKTYVPLIISCISLTISLAP